MGLRKGHCYTSEKRSYTRKSKVKSKSYIKAIPPTKMVKFVMGDSPGFFAGKFSHNVSLVMKEPIQIRDNAMESARMLLNRQLDEKLKGNYYFIVSAYPHHILRENKMLTGAGADRMQTGMAKSFGKPTGVAAQIPENGKVFSIACNKEFIPAVREMLVKIKAKLPGQKSVIVEEMRKV